MSPSLALFLLEPYQHHPFDFLSYTLAELLMLDVLRVEQDTVQVHPNDPARVTYYFLQRGPNFERYHTGRYQQIITHCLIEHERIPFQYLSKLVCKELDWKPGRYRYDYIQPELIQQGLILPMLDWPVHIYLRSRRGRKLKQEIRRQLSLVNQLNPRIYPNRRDQLLTWYQEYGPMILIASRVYFRELTYLPEIFSDPTRWEVSDQADPWWENLESLAHPRIFTHLDLWLKKLEEIMNRDLEGSQKSFGMIDSDWHQIG